MKKPKSLAVQILGHPVLVTQTAPEGFYGQANAKKMVITICNDTTPSQEGDTLLHESLHILSEILCLGLPEDTIGRMSTGLHAYLTQNPQIAMKIIQRERIF